MGVNSLFIFFPYSLNLLFKNSKKYCVSNLHYKHKFVKKRLILAFCPHLQLGIVPLHKTNQSNDLI